MGLRIRSLFRCAHRGMAVAIRIVGFGAMRPRLEPLTRLEPMISGSLPQSKGTPCLASSPRDTSSPRHRRSCRASVCESIFAAYVGASSVANRRPSSNASGSELVDASLNQPPKRQGRQKKGLEPLLLGVLRVLAVQLFCENTLAQRPWKTGLRFSPKAFSASRRSSLLSVSS